MDMFVYGCPRVFRNLNMTNHTIVFYDTASILRDLNLDIDAFREIAVLSGTDYSSVKRVESSTSINTTYNYYTKYKKSGLSFYEWLIQTTSYIDKTDYDKLCKIVKMFVLEDRNFDDFYNKVIDMQSLKTVMKKEGFLFVNGP
jgi:5'-3' exonuclease